MIRKDILDVENEKMKIHDQVMDLIDQRQIARKNKDWDNADQIRDKLNDIGVIVEDSPNGPIWKLK